MKGDPQLLIEQQVKRWALERKAAMEARVRREPPPIRPIITVSRQLGSGGTEMAEILARRLGYHLFDREVIEVMAREAGVHRHIVEALDDRTRSGIEQWMDGVLHARIFTSEDFVRSLGKTLITVARAGAAVVVGRGANFILAGEPAFHVRAVAGFEHRVQRVMRVQELGRKESEERVSRADKDRSDFVSRYLNREINEPTAYHLILNLQDLGLDRGADVVLDVYGRLFSPD